MANRYDYGRTGMRYDRGYDWNTGYDYRPYGRPYGFDYDQYDYDYDYDFQPTYTYYETWWWIPGPYSGIGPEGYQRSDERIREDINDRLMQHGNIDARNIQVDANDCEVTLRGTVPDRRTKRLAEDVAESVAGVNDVHNELRIRNRGQQGSQQQGEWQSHEMHGPAPRREQLRPGMTVVGRDGDQVGTIKEVRDNDFLLDRPMARDVYVPFNAAHMMNGQVMLNIPSDRIDNQNWPTPQMVGSQTSA